MSYPDKNQLITQHFFLSDKREKKKGKGLLRVEKQ